MAEADETKPAEQPAKMPPTAEQGLNLYVQRRLAAENAKREQDSQ